MEDKVIDSRLSKDGVSIRRRRECLKCEQRFTTYEEIEQSDLRVIKRDGRHELFDRHKLSGGIAKACEKRPIGIDQIERIVEEIVQDLQANYEREIPTSQLGARVMEKLHALDDVAYVRYASVYRQFRDIGEFIDEIKSLENKPRPNRLQGELTFKDGAS